MAMQVYKGCTLRSSSRTLERKVLRAAPERPRVLERWVEGVIFEAPVARKVVRVAVQQVGHPHLAVAVPLLHAQLPYADAPQLPSVPVM